MSVYGRNKPNVRAGMSRVEPSSAMCLGEKGPLYVHILSKSTEPFCLHCVYTVCVGLNLIPYNFTFLKK